MHWLFWIGIDNFLILKRIAYEKGWVFLFFVINQFSFEKFSSNKSVYFSDDILAQLQKRFGSTFKFIWCITKCDLLHCPLSLFFLSREKKGKDINFIINEGETFYWSFYIYSRLAYLGVKKQEFENNITHLKNNYQFQFLHFYRHFCFTKTWKFIKFLSWYHKKI